MNNIKVTPKGVQVVYTDYGAGCMVIGMGFMTLSSLFVLGIVPSVSIIKGFFGIIIGLCGTLFFGAVLLRIVTVLLKGRVLLEIEDGNLKNRKHSIPIKNIKQLQFGWHSKKLSGMIFEDLIVSTIDNKEYFLRYYNLLSDTAIKYLVEHYIIPEADTACRMKWEAMYSKVSLSNDENNITM
ncbi:MULTISPECIES: DUF5381 family protein [unclassified Paenibacillus]|uniref:DUF5381 family protein n=1 Tax=unclassified Paenibacillus TaxID=185978 RepID=UPI002789231B|nr:MULTISPECIES: DUF5381 family protein [unclassified Paenibacillus]MDQ0896380.1 hypothetical protein [Paenibacillus sp. V4I7]MDQ0914076.1 hypothetical protein [Paenibacillus sp. V4I5]